MYVIMISGFFFLTFNTALQKARTVIPLDDGSGKNSSGDGNELDIILHE